MESFIEQNAGYSFMLQSPNQMAKQIFCSYKNYQSTIFVTVYLSHGRITKMLANLSQK